MLPFRVAKRPERSKAVCLLQKESYTAIYVPMETKHDESSEHAVLECLTPEFVAAFERHRAAFAPLLAEIVDMLPVAWPEGREPRKERARGYVYAVGESADSGGAVYIGWGSSIRLKEAVRHMQVGNPRTLAILGVALRDSVHDAREICETLHLGLNLYKLRGNWFNVPSYAKVVSALAHIDDEPPAESVP